MDMYGRCVRSFSFFCAYPDCDGRHVAHEAGDTIRKADAEKAARAAGWRKNDAMGWICPAHTSRPRRP